MNKIFGTQVPKVWASDREKNQTVLVSRSSEFQGDRKIKSFSLASDITIGGKKRVRKFC